MNHLFSYSKHKSTHPKFTPATLTTSTTSRKEESQINRSLRSASQINNRDVSMEVKTLRDKINQRLKQPHRQNKENCNHNIELRQHQQEGQPERLSCIRRMLFFSENSEQKDLKKRTLELQKKKLRKKLKTEFEERQKKAITLKKQKSFLLLKEKEKKEYEDCTFKPKLNKDWWY